MKPNRILYGIPLYNEREIFTGVYYGVDDLGWGRLYSIDGYLGLAAPQSFSQNPGFAVQIFAPICPKGNFRRTNYRTLATANQGLEFHALRLIKRRISKGLAPIEPLFPHEAKRGQSDNLFLYHVSVKWTMTGTIPIIAESGDGAVGAAMKATLPEGRYVTGSFEVVPQDIPEAQVKDKNGRAIRTGVLVQVPDPDSSEIHNHAFHGNVGGGHYSFITVVDQEGNAFDIEPRRLEVIDDIDMPHS
jgi:hypothetical protein